MITILIFPITSIKNKYPMLEQMDIYTVEKKKKPQPLPHTIHKY